ncbi:LOW QUALITY PROTEIN: hypothetical protein V2J09_023068 [Rumex salicifolius]
MHNPLCCVTTAANAANAHDDNSDAPPLPPPSQPAPEQELEHKHPSHSHFSQSMSFPSNQSSDIRFSTGSKVRQVARCMTSPARSVRPKILSSLSLSSRDQTEGISIDDVVGGGVCGILYKWVNYGRGWRRRWFALNEGVLSFYKIHGPEKIVVRNEEDIGGKLIGQESFKRICSVRGRSGSVSSRSRCGPPAGEIHLKISTIRESKPDERRFSIYTGTKTIHLRADTREARDAWLEALNTVKGMFPRTSNGGLLDNLPKDELFVSTEKLRARLLQEGVCEAAIQDSEEIMRDEFSPIHRRLLALKRKEALLLDTISRLEAEKVDLETTYLDQIQRQEIDQGASCKSNDNHNGGGLSGLDENSNKHHNHEEGEDSMDEGFRDTKEFLSPCSTDSSGSDFQGSSSLDSDEEDASEMEPSFMSMHNYPYVKRRKKLPDPVEKDKGVSLWSIIKDNIGKDLTKICLPVYFNEPISSLQKGFEDLEYSYLLDRAYEWGKRGNNLMRMLNVAAFAVSGYASTEGRSCKPFNPLLGETYEADFPDKGIRFISEKVSHHPMVMACHCDGQGWKFWGDCNLKNKFQGRSIQIDPVGILTLEFDDGEVYHWNKVSTSIYNIIIGKIYCDHYGTMQIQGSNKYSCKIKFKEQSFMDRNPHQVQGTVLDKKGNTMAKLFGKWDDILHYVDGEHLKKGTGTNSRPHLLWRANKLPKYRSRYNLTRFAFTLNEITPDIKARDRSQNPLFFSRSFIKTHATILCFILLIIDKLPPTDSRLRPDQRHLENGEYELANSEKLRLEERQREARKIQEKGWKPKWFVKDKDGKYNYRGGYWEAREQGNWGSCPKIFGEISAAKRLDS